MYYVSRHEIIAVNSAGVNNVISRKEVRRCSLIYGGRHFEQMPHSLGDALRRGNFYPIQKPLR
jgi:hypothetical protein